MRRVEKTESKLDRVIDIATQLAVAAMHSGHVLSSGGRTPRLLVAYAIDIVETAEREVDPPTREPAR